MKLSNKRLVNNSAKLFEISQKQLPVKVSYAIAKNIAKLERELKIYNTEQEKLIEKYSIKDEKGKTIVSENNQINIQKDKLDDWNKDINELLEIENDIEIHKFFIDALDGYAMTPAELMILDYMIIDEE